jgi:hypothetical protein
VVGEVDQKSLSGSELALYNAITDPKTVATLEVVESSDTVHFGYSKLNLKPPFAGENSVDRSDLNQLDKVLAGEFVAHEVIEAFSSKQGLTNYQLGHAYANKFFGNIEIEQIVGLPEGAKMATSAHVTLNFRRLHKLSCPMSSY